MRFYTIGYGGRKPSEFLEILQAKKIKAVADVRLRPDRAYTGVYVKARSSDKGIEKLLAGAEICYLSFVELGNVFMDHPDWQNKYRLLLQRDGNKLTQRLLLEVQEPFCLMCAEKVASSCHRGLIAEYLVRNGHRLVTHL